MPNKTELSADGAVTSPDYEGLVRFLIEPFLDDPQSLYINAETIKERKKVWLRVAFDDSDRGKVFGRGGRNIQAIRTVLKTAGAVNQESIFLDIYNDEKEQSQSSDRRNSSSSSRRRKGPSKPAPKIAKKS